MGLSGRQDARKVNDGQFTPTNYTPTPVGNEATNKVSAHLKGIDIELGVLSGKISTGTSFPGSPGDGDLFWDESQTVFYLYSSTATAWVDLTSGGNTGQITGKNAIFNGDMRIAQRGTLFATIASSAYCLDRWQYSEISTAVHTITQDSSVPDTKFNTSLKLDCTTADASIGAADLVFVSQKVEGYNFQKFVGQTSTLSFWVKAGKTGTMCVSFRNTSGDRSYVDEVTINLANTWEKKTITLDFDYSGGTWDYTNGIGLRIDFVLMAGSNYQTTADVWQSGNYHITSNQTNFCDNADATCDVWITGVQLELGYVGTDFEFLDYAIQLTQCERYYETIDLASGGLLTIGQAHGATGQISDFGWMTSKRIPPTITHTGTLIALTATSSTAGGSGFVFTSGSDRGYLTISGCSGLVAGNASGVLASGGVVLKLSAEL